MSPSASGDRTIRVELGPRSYDIVVGTGVLARAAAALPGRARVAMKPLASLNRPVLRTVDTGTKEETVSFKERTDVTAVPAAGVVAETMVSLVLAGEVLRKFGGDSLPELLRNYRGYLDQLQTPG